MYTTARYASAETRLFARKAAAGKGEPYVSRGKKTIEQLAMLARKKGEGIIIIIGEHGKNPATLSCLEITKKGGWKWKEKRTL